MKFLMQQLSDTLEIVNVAQVQLERNQLGLVGDNIRNAQKKLNEAALRLFKIQNPVEEPPIEKVEVQAPERKHGESSYLTPEVEAVLSAQTNGGCKCSQTPAVECPIHQYGSKVENDKA
jgi:hypothetical protein